MAKKKPGSVEKSKKVSEARSISIADRGVKTGLEFASLMSALMSDAISARLAPNVVNAACNPAGKLLKVVEMQHKYGKMRSGNRLLRLVG